MHHFTNILQDIFWKKNYFEWFFGKNNIGKEALLTAEISKYENWTNVIVKI